MTIVNGYCTLSEWKARKVADVADATDDSAIDDIITNASRMIDAITGQWFYAYTQTRYFDYDDSRTLKLDAPLLSITTLTNGDGTVITGTYYNLLPLNKPQKSTIELKLSSSLAFLPSATETRGVISIAGSWGLDRAATDPESAIIINNTKGACILIALHDYNSRYGNNISGNVQVTSGGVVVTDFGAIPTAAYRMIAPYRKIT